jgi:uncharacterized protein (TIRG00374 family)
LLRSLRFWLGAGISALLIALFLRATHPSEIADALEDANYWWLLPALAVFFVGVAARCLRWSVLMRPVAPLGPVRLFPYAVIGYMANNLLPARAGEVVRAFITGDRERVSRMGVFGTIAVERLFDGCILVVLLLVSGSLVGFEDERLKWVAGASTALFLAAVTGFYILTLKPERARKVAHRFLRFLPERLEHRAEELADSLVNSLRSVHDWRSLAIVALLSGVAWTIEAGSYALIGQGFDLGVSFGHYCLLLAAANLAIIVPTFFGGTGPFEWAVKIVLVGAGVEGATAGAYSVVSHAFILIPTTVLGLLFLWSWGISFRRVTRSRVDAVEKAAVP